MRILGIFLSIFVVILAGLLIAPQFIDWSQYKSQIISVVKEQTGYEVEVSGDLSLVIFPAPHASVQNLSLRHPEQDKAFIKAESVDVYLDIMPLLSGQIALSSIHLNQPDVALAVLSNGNGNWHPPALAGQSDTQSNNGSAPELSIERLTISEGVFSYLSGKDATPVSLNDIDARVSIQSLSGPFDVNASFVTQEMPVTLDIKANKINTDSQAIPLQLKADVFDSSASLNFSGVVGFGEEPDLQGETSVIVVDINRLVERLASGSAGNVPSVPIKTSGILTASLKEASYTNLKVEAADTVLTGSVKIQDVTANTKKAVIDLKEAGASAFKGNLSISPQKIALSKTSLTYASSKADVSASWSFAERPELRLDMTSSQLDLDEITTRLGLVSGAKSGSTDLKQLASQLALPFDATVKNNIDLLVYQNNRIEKVKSDLVLKNNQVSINQLSVGNYAGAALSTSGKIGNVKSLSDLDLKMSVKTADLEDTLEKTGFQNVATNLPTKIGAFDGKLAVKGSLEKTDFDTTLKALNTTTSVKGLALNALTSPAFQDISFQLQHPNFAQLLKTLNPDAEAGRNLAKPVDFAAAATLDGNVYKFENIKGSFGPIKLNGSVVADVSGKTPQVTGELQTGTLPLDMFVASANSSAGSDVRWSRNAMDFSWMHQANLDLKMKSNKVTYGQWVFDQPSFSLKLKNGTLDIPDFTSGLFGGASKLSTQLSSSKEGGKPVKVNAALELDNVGMQSLVTALTGAPVVQSKGVVDFDTKIDTSGISMAALIFGLNGDGNISGNDITIKGIDVADLTRSVSDVNSLGRQASALFKTGIRGGSSEFEKLDGKFTIKEGIVNFDPLLLQGKDADINTLGNVSLPAWTLDMKSAVYLKVPEGQEAPPPLEISYRGSLSNPGQSFAESAIQNYLNQRISNKVNEFIGDKLGDKLDGELGGVIGGLLGVPVQPKQQQPAPQAQPEPATENGNAEVNTVVPTSRSQEQKEQPKEIKPEEALEGVLRGLLQ